MAKRPLAAKKKVPLPRLTAEHGEQKHREIYAAVGVRQTSLSPAQDSTLQPREDRNIDETSGDAFYEEKLVYISENMVVPASTGRNIS